MAPKIARIQNLLNTTTKYTNMALAHTHTWVEEKRVASFTESRGFFFFGKDCCLDVKRRPSKSGLISLLAQGDFFFFQGWMSLL